jgi:hypothetical protein
MWSLKLFVDGVSSMHNLEQSANLRAVNIGVDRVFD